MMLKEIEKHKDKMIVESKINILIISNDNHLAKAF